MQRERRRDPYPWTWELPAAVTLTALLAAMIGVQLGRSLANLVSGAGWTWPETSSTSTDRAFSSPLSGSFWTSLPGVLSGDSSAGLAPRDAASGVLAGRALTWGTLAVTELAIVVTLGCVALYVLRRWGPGRMQGMATANEAEQLLGVTRLRQVAGIVRPDLYGKHAGLAPTNSVPGSIGDRLDESARLGTPLRRDLTRRLTVRPGKRSGEALVGWPGERPGDRASPWQSAGRSEREATGERTHGSSGQW